MSVKLRCITSLSALDAELKRGTSDFFIDLGVARSSKYIIKEGQHYFVCHYIDSTEQHLTAIRLMRSNIGKAILGKLGRFYTS